MASWPWEGYFQGCLSTLLKLLVSRDSLCFSPAWHWLWIFAFGWWKWNRASEMNWWALGPLVSPPVYMWAIFPLSYFGILAIGSHVCLPLKAVLLRKPLFRALFGHPLGRFVMDLSFGFVSVHSMMYDGYSCCLFVKCEALIQFQLTALWGVFWVFGRILIMIIWPNIYIYLKTLVATRFFSLQGEKKEKIGWDERIWNSKLVPFAYAGRRSWLDKTSLDNSDCEQISPFRRKLHSPPPPSP